MVSVSPLQLALLLSAHTALVYGAASPTYEAKDPVSGEQLRCDRCPPGTYLRSHCSATQQTACAACPEGSFTQLWNYVSKCLRCGVCSLNQVVKTPCTAENDCVCECKQGYFYKQDYDMCVRLSECPSGQGVQTEGTPERDTVCHFCSDGTYSDISSAHQKCMAHKNCSDAGLQTVLRGSTWHNSLCANCAEVKDAADYLKEIVPAIFVHHPMNMQRLRRIVLKLPSDNSKSKREISRKDLSLSALHAQINSWAASATASQVRQLIAVLTPTRASAIAGRLQNKLEHIDRNLEEQCHLENMNMVI